MARHHELQCRLRRIPAHPHWSNPRVIYKGEPTGTPAADNARLILELAEPVSTFR